ncbi:MAG: hypothetical protein ACO3BD_02100, partial [Chitinophagaceae bacterium]
NLMWYTLPDSNKQYPVTIERVREILSLNARGQQPEELGAVELSTSKGEEKEMAHVELVGQISLRTLERNSRRRRDRERSQQQGRPTQGKPQASANPRAPLPKGNAPAQQGPRPQRNDQRNDQRSNRPPRRPDQRPPKKDNP